MASMWLRNFQKAQDCISKRESQTMSPVQYWRAPPDNHLKLNVDASVLNNGSAVGVGGLIRNSSGQVMGAFSRRISGCFSPFAAECLALREGLLFAKNRGLRVSLLESESCNAVRAINGAFLFAAECPIINDVKLLMEEAGCGTCSHIPRKCNMAAHTLAK